jgi:16S rRNA (uracil1498-N3)-methyltransferase
MRRFLLPGKFTPGERVRLSPEESRHALRSLRLSVGDPVLLANGAGEEAEGRLLSADPEGAEVEILRTCHVGRRVRLELLQAPLKGPKMDWLVEKLTEMGVAALHLARTRHTVAAGEKIERWQRIASAAVKQSGSPLLPEIVPLKPLAEAATSASSGAFCILLQPGAIQGLAELVKEASREGAQRVLLAVGPEGGFSPEEEAQLLQAGFRPAALSPQVLRGETAALAALAIAAHSIDF